MGYDILLWHSLSLPYNYLYIYLIYSRINLLHHLYQIISKIIIFCKKHKPIRYIIFDFNKRVSDLDIDANTPDSQECKDSKFIYPILEFVILILNDPKCRFPIHIEFERCREETVSALNHFGIRWCER